ncbi:hypothetical protein TRIUR3_30401 [Triticum urartu]|uniref:Uncharacterized protein n=1 Tax=Triticum urartu TaxID=4572 RepID=M8AMD5_TRIUA|nr:hypothetical protein TRIUR3_30401 [Triticum urartu]
MVATSTDEERRGGQAVPDAKEDHVPYAKRGTRLDEAGVAHFLAALERRPSSLNSGTSEFVVVMAANTEPLEISSTSRHVSC